MPQPKAILIAAAAWVCALGVAVAQPNFGPPSQTMMYGPSPASLPPAVTTSGSNSPGTTDPNPLGSNPSASTMGNITNTGSTIVVANTTVGNATANSTIKPGGNMTGTAIMSSVTLAPPRIVTPMPSSMDKVDNEHKLQPNDRIALQVREDDDSPYVVFVDEKGFINVRSGEYGKFQVANMTLHDAVAALKTELDKNLYYDATVLAALYDPTRGQFNIAGEVQRQGSIALPDDNVLTLYGAIQLAGGFLQDADKGNISLFHSDDDTSKSSNLKYNVDDILSKKIKDPSIASGDFISVPKSGETSGYVTVSGEVGHPGLIQVPANGKMTVSVVILLSGGFTEWGKHDVILFHTDKDGKIIKKIIDIDAILNEGHTEKDVKVEPGDTVYVDKKFFAIG